MNKLADAIQKMTDKQILAALAAINKPWGQRTSTETELRVAMLEVWEVRHGEESTDALTDRLNAKAYA